MREGRLLRRVVASLGHIPTTEGAVGQLGVGRGRRPAGLGWNAVGIAAFGNNDQQAVNIQLGGKGSIDSQDT
jgi:hypothetical protein